MSSAGSKAQRYGICAIVLLGIIAYGGGLLSPSLFGDDWGMISAAVDGTLQCPAWNTLRPFGFCWPALQYRLFGLHPLAFHATGMLLNVLMALLVLLVLSRLLPKWGAWNLMAAMLFLVYPTDYTHDWITGSNVKVPLVIFLAGCLLFIEFFRGKGWWHWLGSLALFSFSFGFYEVQLGLVAVGSVSFFAAGRRQPWLRRLALLAPLAIAILFTLWRWQAFAAAGGAYGHSTESVSGSLPTAMDRILFGVRINVGSGWTAVMRELLPIGQMGAGPRVLLSVLFLAGFVSLAVLAAAAIRLWREGGQEVTPSIQRRRWASAVPLAVIALVALVAIGVGYVPMALAESPALRFTTSRSNVLPSIGAAVLVCAVVQAAARLLSRDAHRADTLALAAVVPLLLLGVWCQLLVQQQVDRAWSDQRRIWQGVFRLAPDIQEETNVVLVLKGYETPWGLRDFRPFVSGPWGFGAALDILYGRDGIDGVFTYGDPEKLLGYTEGQLVVWSGGRHFLPASKTLVFVYDRHGDSLRRMATLDSGGQKIPLGPNRTSEAPTRQSGLRWLVR